MLFRNYIFIITVVLACGAGIPTQVSATFCTSMFGKLHYRPLTSDSLTKRLFDLASKPSSQIPLLARLPGFQPSRASSLQLFKAEYNLIDEMRHDQVDEYILSDRLETLWQIGELHPDPFVRRFAKRTYRVLKYRFELGLQIATPRQASRRMEELELRLRALQLVDNKSIRLWPDYMKRFASNDIRDARTHALIMDKQQQELRDKFKIITDHE